MLSRRVSSGCPMAYELIDQAEVTRLQATQPTVRAAPSPPSHDIAAVAPDTASLQRESIAIPHDILPVLAILREHIAELSQDNAALRYTFMGGPLPSGIATPGGGTAALEKVEIGGGQSMKLERIVARVKELVHENEELGELVLSLGKASPQEWQQALDGELSFVRGRRTPNTAADEQNPVE